ncbi:outer membrane protein assembly factor BamE [Roseivivax marinus]|nr:outer membrane protein assembly factor BamE [Roseivivax marinus]UMA66424.1 outer membrane protein assembly factor BamE [Roseivivax marinus]
MWGRAERKGAKGRVLLIGLAMSAVLAGCAPQVSNHGYVPPEEDLARIVPGIDTRDTVTEVIGVPSSAGVLNDSGYYYISSTMSRFAWRAPQVVDREVVAISFTDGGVVRGIERYGLEDGRVVPLTRRVTDNAGGDIGFIRRLFGNIGRLQASDLLSN